MVTDDLTRPCHKRFSYWPCKLLCTWDDVLSRGQTVALNEGKTTGEINFTLKTSNNTCTNIKSINYFENMTCNNLPMIIIILI